jgi:hypothetical protein
MTTSDQQVSRRGFLKAAAVTGAAAVVTGTGAATIMQQTANAPLTTTVVSAPTALPAASLPNPAYTTANEMLAKLAAAQAENVRLQAALDAANRQLTGISTDNQDSMAATEALNVQLGEANNQIGILAGLVSLYEHLDSVDVGTAVENGLTAVSGTLNNILGDIPTLEESLAMGELALAQVENHIPLLENGRLWLDNHTDKLNTYFVAIENVLAEVLEAAGPILEMLNNWFESVKKWLPFGIGQKAANVMQSITMLLIETPATISGLDTNIAQPLSVWLAADNDNEIPLRKNLIKPIREQVLAQTTNVVGKTKEIEVAYAEQLRVPVESAVSSQRAIRGLIAAYREENQI